MSEPDEQVAMDPQDALRQLIESDGFRVLIEHVREQWGSAAVNRKVRGALTSMPAHEHSGAIQAILGTADSIRALFAWPDEEYARLRTRTLQAAQPEDRFAEHRRA